MASSSACSSIHVAQINFSRPITRSMAQIARSGFSRTPASQPPGSFSRFSSPSPDSCPKPESQIYIQQLQLLRSFSFSSPILFLSLPSISLPHPPGASKGGGVGRAACGARRRRPSSSVSVSSTSASSSSSLPRPSSRDDGAAVAARPRRHLRAARRRGWGPAAPSLSGALSWRRAPTRYAHHISSLPHV